MKISAWDVVYFVGEIGVYVAVGWWAATRPLPAAGRIGLAIALVAVFVVLWALFAAPKASHPLSGAADTVFRIVWFALGAAAAIAVVVAAAGRS